MTDGTCKHRKNTWTRGDDHAFRIMRTCKDCGFTRLVRRIAACVVDGGIVRVDADVLATETGLELVARTEWRDGSVAFATWAFDGIATTEDWAAWCAANKAAIVRVSKMRSRRVSKMRSRPGPSGQSELSTEAAS
jgi:hypothetical protein